MVSAGAVLDELIERAVDRQRFYRPERRPKPGAAAKQCKKRSGKVHWLQLELFADEPISQKCYVLRDAERSLFDLIPEAYD
jgi:hypothetical protein